MKQTLLLVASASAVKVTYEPYREKPIEYPLSDMWSTVKRGDVYDFATQNVEKAMKANPSSGNWPIKDAPDLPNSIGLDDDNKRLMARYVPWETVVKKGTDQAATNANVEAALSRKPEPVMIAGKVVNPANGTPPPEDVPVAEAKPAAAPKAPEAAPADAKPAAETAAPAAPAETTPAAKPEAAPSAKPEAAAAAQ